VCGKSSKIYFLFTTLLSD